MDGTIFIAAKVSLGFLRVTLRCTLREEVDYGGTTVGGHGLSGNYRMTVSENLGTGLASAINESSDRWQW